jgi:hypothetical protein
MTIKQLGRVFLRFHGLLFIGSVIYECMNMARDYRTFVTDALYPENQIYGQDIFWLGVFRTSVYALTALVLLFKTDRVISALAGKADVQSNEAPSETLRPDEKRA